MKKISMMLILLSSVIAISTYAKPAPSQSLDQIAAIVNDDIITKSEFNRQLIITKMQLAQAQAPTPSEKALRKQVIDQMINKKLQLQIAKQAGVTVDDHELDKAVQLVADQNQISVDVLYEKLGQEGMTKQAYREEIRKQLMLQKVQQQEAATTHLTVTPGEINRFLHSHKWQQPAQESSSKEYHLTDILIPLPENASIEDIKMAENEAESLLAQLKAGKHLSTMMTTSLKFHPENNDLGWRNQNEIPSAFVDKIVSLQPNEFAGPIQAGNGFHLIQLMALRGEKTTSSPPDRKQVEGILMQHKFEEAVQTWVSKLRGQAFIDIRPQITMA